MVAPSTILRTREENKEEKRKKRKIGEEGEKNKRRRWEETSRCNRRSIRSARWAGSIFIHRGLHLLTVRMSWFNLHPSRSSPLHWYRQPICREALDMTLSSTDGPYDHRSSGWRWWRQRRASPSEMSQNFETLQCSALELQVGCAQAERGAWSQEAKEGESYEKWMHWLT